VFAGGDADAEGSSGEDSAAGKLRISGALDHRLELRQRLREGGPVSDSASDDGL
jgi:hypothetical protein